MEYALIVLLLVQILLYDIKCSSSHIENIPICTPTGTEQEPIHLTAHGFSSSAYVLLKDIDMDAVSSLQWPPARGRLAAYPDRGQPTCRLRVTAPPGHVVYVAVLETRLEIHRALIVHQEERDVKCQLNIFLPDTTSKAVYSANMCDVDPVADVPLLPSELEITWQPPKKSERADFEILTKDRMLLLTAVGKEATCRPPTTPELEAGSRHKYHTCMKIGWDPILCVSKDLVCNGEKNCPKGSTSSDEAAAICRAPQSLEDIARKFIQEFQLPHGFHEKWVESAKKQTDPSTTTENNVARNHLENIWKKMEVSTRRSSYSHLDNDSTPSKTHAASSTTTDSSTVTISTILNQYGPWGYLMLGMLICGGVLLLCGMWECCCRRPKPFLGGSHRSGGSGGQMGHRSGGAGGATVLIINHGEDTARPPEYEDLDQPPLYSALFPNNKATEPVTVTVIPMEERRPSEDGHQQTSRLSRQNSTINRGEVIVTNPTTTTTPKDEDTSSNQNQSSSASSNVNASESNADVDTAGNTASSTTVTDSAPNDS